MLATSSPRTSLRRPVGRPALLLLGIGAILVTTVFATAAGSYVWPDEPRPTTPTTRVGSVEEFPIGNVTPLGRLGVAGYLVHLETGEFVTFDRAEPVFGCTLPWRAAIQAFRDPCHGYEYDISGQPSSGNPVRVPMNQFEVRIDRQGTIRVITAAEIE